MFRRRVLKSSKEKSCKKSSTQHYKKELFSFGIELFARVSICCETI